MGYCAHPIRIGKNQSKEVAALKEIGYDYYVSGRAKKSLSNSMGDNLYLF